MVDLTHDAQRLTASGGFATFLYRGYDLTANKQSPRTLVLLMICAVLPVSAFAVESKGTDGVVVKLSLIHISEPTRPY